MITPAAIEDQRVRSTMHLLLTSMRHGIYFANTKTCPCSEIGIFGTSAGKLERTRLDELVKCIAYTNVTGVSRHADSCWGRLDARTSKQRPERAFFHTLASRKLPYVYGSDLEY